MAVGHYLTRYREDCGPLQLDFSTDTLKTLVQLHRTLKCPRWGWERVAFILSLATLVRWPGKTHHVPGH